MFITFEGIEGSGKTTQLNRFVDHIKKYGIKTCVTREPGGTEFGESIRNVILDSRFKKMQPLAELYLLAAVRCQHVNDVINPALNNKQFVVCDRYGDSTVAYQVGGRKLDREMVLSVHRWATDGTEPDLTFIFDCPVEIGLSRAKKRSIADRMESEAVEFHERVRMEYLDIAKREPKRVVVIDGTKPEDVVWNNLLNESVKRIECLKKY